MKALIRFLQYGSLADAAAARITARLVAELPQDLCEEARLSFDEEVEHARLQRRLAAEWGATEITDGPYPTFWRGLTAVCDLPFAATCLAVVESASAIQFRALAQKMAPIDWHTSEVLRHIAREELRHVDRGVRRLQALKVPRNDVVRVCWMVNAMTLADPVMGEIARAFELPEIPGVRIARSLLRRL